MEFPKEICKVIGNRNYTINTIGKSGSDVLCFDDMVLKIETHSEESECEHQMMAWLFGRLPVPEVICAAQQDGKQYLLMSKAEGEMACEEKFIRDPEKLTGILADGLRKLWQVKAAGCPVQAGLDQKLRLAEFRVANGLCDLEDVEPETYGEGGFSSPAELLAWLKENRPQEDLVFSHGDFCLPNIFIKDGTVSGFIDLGRSGIADRYQDIALCWRSLRDNLTGRYCKTASYEFRPECLFEQLDIAWDREKMRYYLLLDELF